MIVVLYMAITVNGYIAKENDETPWSEEEWISYKNMIKKTGNLIIGKKTYEIMLHDGEFEKIGNPFTIVVNSSMKSHDNFRVAKNPQEALKIVEGNGFKTALVGGGSSTNTSFLREALVDEIMIDIEPLLFGKGIPLFKQEEFDINLQLLAMKKLNDTIIQLHYRVI